MTMEERDAYLVEEYTEEYRELNHAILNWKQRGKRDS